MEYKIVTIDKEANVETIVESLSETEYEGIIANVRKLQKSMMTKDYYIVVRDNIRDLLELLSKIDYRDKHMFPTINRYTYNVLGAFYAWIEYYESNYKALFTPIKQKYYDNNFCYRMMYSLRIYMTHCEMAVTDVTVKPMLGEMYVYIDPAKMLENHGRLQKSFIPELQDKKDKGEKIDLYELATDFQKTFTDMHKELLKGLEPEIQPVINDLRQYLRFDENDIALTTNICEKNTGKHIYGLTSFLGKFVDKMCNPY